jgi:CRP-like cAMP-binding protein
MLPPPSAALDPFLLQELSTDFHAIAQSTWYPKQHTLHEQGQICSSLYFVEQGVLHSYYYKKGKAVSAHFATEGHAISAIDSYIQQKRSRYTVQVLERAFVHRLDRSDVEQLLIQKPQYEKCVRLFLEHIYIELAERVEALLFYTAKERYLNLLKAHPNLTQRVNLGYIASYLGITAETLSRIRAQATT